MYVMLLFGMVGSALVFGWLLSNYTPGRLIQVIQGAAVVTVLLNGLSIWKQEALNRARAAQPQRVRTFRATWAEFANQVGALRLLVVVAFGTFGFGMADVLLEPYGGQVLQMSVAQTTKLTAVLAFGTLLGFGMASRVLGRGGRPEVMCGQGAFFGVPGFALIIASSQLGLTWLFVLGTLLCGYGAGLFGHGSLTATMRNAPRDQIGMALGAWGAVQATAAGAGVVLGGLVRDLILALAGGGAPELPYLPVFGIEILFLVMALVVLVPILRRRAPRQGDDQAYIQ
jgi:BCD family chlorophyll transporter-like MFS transporter